MATKKGSKKKAAKGKVLSAGQTFKITILVENPADKSSGGGAKGSGKKGPKPPPK
jgi:hypothetical protein